MKNKKVSKVVQQNFINKLSECRKFYTVNQLANALNCPKRTLEDWIYKKTKPNKFVIDSVFALIESQGLDVAPFVG